MFIQNFRPGGLARFGLDYESVARRNPAIIYCSISGFGAGRGAQLPGYDVLVQGVSGLMSLTGAPDTPPFRSGISVFDVFTGLHSAVGILAALHHRDVTGAGQHIETNLLSTALSAMVNQSSAYVAGGVVPHRMGNSHLSLFPYEPLATGDGDLIIAAGNDRQFSKLAAALGAPELADDDRFRSVGLRNDNREELRPLLLERLAAKSAQEWFGILTDAGIACGPINDVRGGVELAASLGLEPVVMTGDVPTVRNPIRMSATPPRHELPPPALNADGDDIRAWLGFGSGRNPPMTSDQPAEPAPPDRHDQPVPSFPTSLGTSEGSTITLLGQDLARDLMGHISFGELAYWLITLRRPTPQQSRLFEAVLIGLADHGFTPTAIAARLTYLSAPDAIQGALTAGLLGGGSRFLGVTEDTGRFLAEALRGGRPAPCGRRGLGRPGGARGGRPAAVGRFVPGLGHPVHKDGDPRTPRIIGIAREEGLYGPHLALFEAIGRVHPKILGKWLPLNGAGVSGAALADLGLPLEVLRGVVLLARCAGLLGHIAEEIRRPVASSIYLTVDRNAEYIPPIPDGPDAT